MQKINKQKLKTNKKRRRRQMVEEPEQQHQMVMQTAVMKIPERTKMLLILLQPGLFVQLLRTNLFLLQRWFFLSLEQDHQ